MPIDRFVLLIVVVIACAGATVWLGATLAAMLALPALGWLAAIPPILVGIVVVRVVMDRLKSREDDHYDSIEK